MPPQAQGPAQPTQRTIPVGTASIIGTVTGADTGRPVRGARVNLNGTVPSAAPIRGAGPGGTAVGGIVESRGMAGLSRSAVTDAQGQFAITRLPAGRFNLSVNHPGNAYLMVNYGPARDMGKLHGIIASRARVVRVH